MTPLSLSLLQRTSLLWWLHLPTITPAARFLSYPNLPGLICPASQKYLLKIRLGKPQKKVPPLVVRPLKPFFLQNFWTKRAILLLNIATILLKTTTLQTKTY